MRLLWRDHSKKTTDPSSLVEKDFDIDMTAAGRSVFFESPWALGTYGQGRCGAPWNPNVGMEQNPKRDSTSLKLGERMVVNPLWQYNYFADPRLSGFGGGGEGGTGINASSGATFGSGYGRIYNERIRGNSLVVYIQPGRPKFYGTGAFFSGDGDNFDNYRRMVIEKATEEMGSNEFGGINSLASSLQALLNVTAEDGKLKDNPTRFYDFSPDFQSFRTFTKSILDELAVRMGLTDLYAEKHKLFNWNFETTTDIMTVFMEPYGFIGNSDALHGKGVIREGFIPFRIEKSSDVSDSFSNSPGQSSIAAQTKGVSDTIKEVHFLTGGGLKTSRKGKEGEIKKAS